MVLSRASDGWAMLVDYGRARRWSVETAYSTFARAKRVFGEGYMAKTLENIARDLRAKVALYNILTREDGPRAEEAKLKQL